MFLSKVIEHNKFALDSIDIHIKHNTAVLMFVTKVILQEYSTSRKESIGIISYRRNEIFAAIKSDLTPSNGDQLLRIHKALSPCMIPLAKLLQGGY